MNCIGLLVLHCIFFTTASSTCTKLPPNSELESTNRQILESVAPCGYQMCINQCERNSACLYVRYDRDQLLCELLGGTPDGAEGTPAVLENKSTVCNISACDVNFQHVQLSTGEATCVLKDQRYGNAAIEKPASLSSIWVERSNASFAVDGLVDFHYGYCANSQGYEDLNPYLSIDLLRDFSINHVAVFTRLDDFTYFFHDVEVRVGQSNTWEEMSTCGLIKEAAEFGRPSKIQCQSCLLGRYVTLRITGNDARYTDQKGNQLSICEVIVFAR